MSKTSKFLNDKQYSRIDILFWGIDFVAIILFIEHIIIPLWGNLT